MELVKRTCLTQSTENVVNVSINAPHASQSDVCLETRQNYLKALASPFSRKLRRRLQK